MLLLPKDKYHKLLAPLQELSLNHFFAKSVVKKIINGWVYVDAIENPETFYVIHPYGMSMLFGNCNNTAFNTAFKKYALNKGTIKNKGEWLQAFPSDWNRVLEGLFSGFLAEPDDSKEQDKIELHTRVNFKFNKESYLQLKQVEHKNYTIVRTDSKIFEEMKGGVVPVKFWNNANDFINQGLGFSLFYENKLAATAYSAFIHDNNLELGIETFKDYRGKGFAYKACSALIDYCLENNYEPVWACRLGNVGSYKLAQKLGFSPIKELPYYKLPNCR